MAGSPDTVVDRPGRQLPWRVLALALGCTVAGVVLGSMVGVLDASAALASLLAVLVGTSLIGTYWPRATFGAANTVTLMRVVGTSWAAGLTVQALLAELSRTGQVLLVVVGTVCLVLDGVDGRVARARGEVSAFGARFDMETDAALLLALSVTAAAVGAAGWWVVAIGGMRYLYVAVSFWVAALRTPLPFRYVRKVVAVVQGVALLLALAVDLAGAASWWPEVVLVPALALLCWSFGRDVAWQLRQR